MLDMYKVLLINKIAYIVVLCGTVLSSEVNHLQMQLYIRHIYNTYI